ncbi:MAG: porin [Bacteroidales bacterium]|nr:porin [Candidatus Sodaliphilus aphodohippi]
MRLMKKVLLLVVATAITAAAQDNAPVNINFEARGDYQRDYVDGETVKDNTGFKGQYFNIEAYGNITGRFSYYFKHRLNKSTLDSHFFDATEQLHLDYQFDDHFSLSAGKQVVAIGGMEYYRAPIDLYYCSQFWNNIACYEWGVSASYATAGNRDRFTVQFCESPFAKHIETSDAYGYSLLWSGRHSWFKSEWSVNLFEIRSGHFINYIALGNSFDLGDKVTVELDYLNRASSHQTFLFKDCTVVGEVGYRPSIHFRLHAKASYDVNRSGTDADLTVADGTEVTRLGAGIEYYPLGTPDIRLHAAYAYSWGTNTDPAPAVLDKQSYIDVGLSWKVDLLKLFKLKN